MVFRNALERRRFNRCVSHLNLIFLIKILLTSRYPLKSLGAEKLAQEKKKLRETKTAAAKVVAGDKIR